MNHEYGIFNDESADYTAIEALEADFYSRSEAEQALRDRYSDDPHAHVHLIEEPCDDDDEPQDDEQEESDDE